jgi:SAM-dependent methyltransferase
MVAGSGEGYVEGSDYLHSYISELNPLHAQLSLLAAGVAAPRVATACELGYGQGLTVNLLAAASPVRWFGTDFNALHAATAQEMGVASGANPALFDQSFNEFCARTDLPDFDFIGLHGIWTWVSDENRSVIVDFIRRKLRPGGVAYVSYNALPACAAMLPMRDVLTGYAAQVAAPGHGILGKAT